MGSDGDCHDRLTAVSVSPVRGHRLGSIEVALVGGVAIAGIAVARNHALWRDQFYMACPAWTIFGVPCPTCGATRAVVAAMQGDLLVAFTWNPLAAVLAIGAVLSLPLTVAVLCGTIRAPRVPSRLAASTRTGLFVLFGANWLYLLLFFGG